MKKIFFRKFFNNIFSKIFLTKFFWGFAPNPTRFLKKAGQKL